MAVFSASSFVSTIPLGTRVLTGLLIFFTFFLALLRLTRTEVGLHLTFSAQDSALSFPWIVIVPGASWVYPWTLVTAAFAETTVIEFLVSLAALPLAGRYLERQWGAVELLRFSAIVVVISNVIAWGLALLLFAIFSKEALIYGTQYHGLQALQVAFLVALTQAIPEHQVQILKKVKLRVKDLPMLYVTVSNVACIIGYTSPFILIQFGWLVSWAYLRFFQLSETGGYRGDRSEAFAFVNWFPPIAHPVVQVISTKLFDLFVKLRIVKPWSGGNYSDLESASTAAAPPSRAEAERRRAMALKALDQRIAKPTTTTTPSRQDSSSSANNTTTPTVVFEAPTDDDGDIGTSTSKPNATKESA